MKGMTYKYFIYCPINSEKSKLINMWTCYVYVIADILKPKTTVSVERRSPIAKRESRVLIWKTPDRNRVSHARQ